MLTVSETVPPPPMLDVVPAASDVADIQSLADRSAGEIAVSAAARLKDHGFQARGIALQGDPKSVIVDYAKEWAADLVVVGSCEKSRLEKFILGSVTESVVKHAPCSVLVIKPETRDNR